ncbi:outer membrane beta-barrel protein [Archangium minus]|uniref:Outer membrane beta-barrel protein n=2 Tax=Archangium minus TaxID=83450 RepID=A0ABY9WK33_9BACT|nr:outer membrane beta-barrel protein [Archangium minus]
MPSGLQSFTFHPFNCHGCRVLYASPSVRSPVLSLRLHSIRAALAALALLAAPVMAQTPAPEGTAPTTSPSVTTPADPVTTPVEPVTPEPPAPVDEAAAPAAAQDVPVADPGAAAAGEDPHPDPLPEGEGGAEDEMMADSATPPPGFTGVYGQVTDAQTKETLIEATVKVVTGAQKSVLTDVDGNYQLALPPGKYDLRIFYDVYEGRRITGVVVEEGKATKLDVQLSADAGAVQEVVVEARADRRAEGALLQERKKAAAVSDAISSQEIARTPDSSASDAVKRVVSATVVDGRFVLLRGLGGRYAVTLLNGAMLPSPEPDEPSVPLDLFPTSLLANLNVVKSYTTDLPGTFGGGTLLIETNTYPSKFELKPRITLSGDSIATFQQRNGQPGSFLESLSFPGPERRLPADLPRNERMGSSVDTWRSFSNVWSARQTRSLPNLGLGVSMGDTLRFGNRRLGYLATVNYGRKETARVAEFARATRPEEELEARDAATTLQGSESTSLSALASVGYQFDRDNELTLFSLYTRGTDSAGITSRGVNSERSELFESTRLQFVSRFLSFNQVRGFHRLNGLSDAEIDWQANFSRVERDEPDTRDTLYSDDLSDPSGKFSFPSQPNSGERFFAGLGESSTGGSASLTLPFSDVRLKAGGMAQMSFRDFSARRFRYQLTGEPVDASLPPEQLFASDNLGAGIRMRESTRGDDAYDAYLGIFAGFVTADYKPVEPLRLVGGVRVEHSLQQLTAHTPFDTTPTANNDSKYLDVLPALNAIYALSPEVNLRAGYSYTLARPTFRELAPFIFFDFVRRRNVSGKPDLLETRIHNIDARAEWFVGENEVLAASAFYKQFEDPIERIILNPQSGDVGFDNADGARSYGVELEARASLARISPVLSNFRAAANLTLIQSNIILTDPDKLGAQTNSNRPMQGQSPYVINLNLGYDRQESGTEVALLYNVYGPRISEVGVQKLPDVYEKPFHRVDLAISQKLGSGMQLKLTGSNLLNSAVVLDQGGITVLKYRPGIAFSASLGWTL